ncbi:MAG TPA: class I SAM-dependent methyltransferase [Methylomirabilota bacterium]|nr:class I SAM-dependent methyltransferase [Methylomirabilota bacterium]
MRGVEQIPWLYDAICAIYERLGLGRWRRWLVGGASGRVLDVGCGTGRNLALLPRGVVAVGLDPSWDAVQRARGRAPQVPLVLGRAEALPFRDAAFDTVLSGLVFCTVPDAQRGLDEVRRVLAPHGQLRMLEHVRSTRPWKARFQDRVQPIWTRLAGGCHPNRDTERAVESSGFRIDLETRRARDEMRRFVARPRAPGSPTSPPP